MEAVGAFETLIHVQETTMRDIPRVSNLSKFELNVDKIIIGRISLKGKKGLFSVLRAYIPVTFPTQRSLVQEGK
jgi:hypothetical protein